MIIGGEGSDTALITLYTGTLQRRTCLPAPATPQICGATAIEELSGRRVTIIGPRYSKNFRVGRLDSLSPSPTNTLPAADASPSSFAAFWKARGFTMEEAIALMGSHALIDEQACLVKGPDQYCDPTVSSCQDVRMFR